MSQATIPVDLFNPGQVFACLGFLEAAEVLLGNASGAFDWSEPSKPRFHLKADGSGSPVRGCLEFLTHATVKSIAPAGSANSTTKWHVETVVLDPDSSFPSSDPESPATLPALLEAGGKTLLIDYWTDQTSRDPVKLWAGGNGYPGAALVRDAINLVRARCLEASEDPFAFSEPQSSSFRFDWRRDYIPIDSGFSLNSHKRIASRIVSLGFPLVEIFAALGMGHARPKPLDERSPCLYRYGVVGTRSSTTRLFEPCLLRASLGGQAMPFPQRTFRMRLGWPGKEGQGARSITTVSEEGGLR